MSCSIAGRLRQILGLSSRRSLRGRLNSSCNDEVWLTAVTPEYSRIYLTIYRAAKSKDFRHHITLSCSKYSVLPWPGGLDSGDHIRQPE
jgi:hypothetical protein